MLDRIQELVTQHNVINSLEGFSIYNFKRKEVSPESTLFFINFPVDSVTNYMRYQFNYEYINMYVFSDYVRVEMKIFDAPVIRYLQKKYSSRDHSGEFAAFIIKDIDLVQEFIQKDVEFLLDNTA